MRGEGQIELKGVVTCGCPCGCKSRVVTTFWAGSTMDLELRGRDWRQTSLYGWISPRCARKCWGEYTDAS